MHNRKRMSVLCLAVGIGMPSLTPAQANMVMGYGTQSCGTWTANRITGTSAMAAAAVGPKVSDLITTSIMQKLLMETWVTGFVSAYNIWESSNGDILVGKDANGLYAWMDNYCAKHPLDQLAAATNALVIELFRDQIMNSIKAK
jgi:hypothetical protein